MFDDPQFAEFMKQLEVTEQQKRSAKMAALAQFGFGLLGARKGQEGQALGRGGLLATDAFQKAMGGAREDNAQKFQLAQYVQQIKEKQRVSQGMQAATQAATTPEMGPPTPDGQMQPGGFDFAKFATAAAPYQPERSMAMLQQLQPKPEKSPWAEINPKDFTPESLREFGQTRDPTVLKARVDPKESSPFGKVSPGDFTPQSLAKYAQSGNYADLAPIDKTPRTTVNIDNAPKLPAGYRWKDGMVGQQVEALPGGPHDTSKKDAATRSGEVAQANIVLSKISQARDLVNRSALPTTGFLGGQMAKIKGTPAYDLQQLLEPIKANIGFDSLNQMRQTSPTGGALGNVTVRELELLQSKIASVEQAQSRVQFLRALHDVETEYNKIIHGPAGGGKKIDDLIKKYAP
jgi:hypothetical protein